MAEARAQDNFEVKGKKRAKQKQNQKIELTEVKTLSICSIPNRPFQSCVLSCLAFE